MPIKIYRSCENPMLYFAEEYSYPNYELLWQTQGALSFDELNSLLLLRGWHQTDIYDAKHEALKNESIG